MSHFDYLTFPQFIKQTYSKDEYLLFDSLCELLLTKRKSSLVSSDITSYAQLPEARLYHYFPEGVTAIIKALLSALIVYCKQAIFGPVEEEYESYNKELSGFAEILQRFQDCGEVKLLMTLDPHEYTEHFNEYYLLWETLLVGVLYTNRLQAPDLSLVQHSILLIHGSVFMDRIWQKTTTISYILKSLGALWYDVLGDSVNHLACSAMQLSGSRFILGEKCEDS